jgi:hypothetical protein
LLAFLLLIVSVGRNRKSRENVNGGDVNSSDTAEDRPETKVVTNQPREPPNVETMPAVENTYVAGVRGANARSSHSQEIIPS